MRKGRTGISTMVGMAIIIAIFFTTLIPLYLYMSSLYNLLSNEINSRMIRDVDRGTEDLKLFVEGRSSISQGGPSINLVLKNTSPLLIRVERIWMMNVETGSPVGISPCIERITDVPPGWNVTVDVNTCTQGFTGRAQFIAVTERGRLFGSAPVDLIGGRIIAGLYPYTLTVSVINMKRGNEYTIDILPLGSADIHPRSITYKATASNENVSLSFGATAGTFLVSLREGGVLISTSRLIAPPTNPAAVTLPDYWNVVFILSRDEIRAVSLTVEISAPSRVLEGESFIIDIFLTLLGEAREDVQVNTDAVRNALNLLGDYDPHTFDCTTLAQTISPGSTENVLRCYARAGELQGNRNQGTITVSIEPVPNAGVGSSSGQTYPSSGDSLTIQVTRQRGGR